MFILVSALRSGGKKKQENPGRGATIDDGKDGQTLRNTSPEFHYRASVRHSRQDDNS
ncbi:hypothetical protein ACFQUU_00835 [Herbaspirillum sp. GCM10030257]|uniref:hypothetical protein n=1 Tax=Herbaspirillum sp. GCM10030257 TaxID=3273393 RepID=UPI0036146EB8